MIPERAPATITCPHCGDPIQETDARCPSCAEVIAASSSTAATAPAASGSPARPLAIVAPDPKDKLFCEIAIDLGFVVGVDAVRALEQQRVDEAIGQKKPIGAYLHEMQLLSREQIGRIVKMQDRVAQTHATSAAPASEPSRTAATRPRPRSTGAEQSPLSRLAYLLLGIFAGCLGIHNFAAGYVGRGVAQLLITVVLGWLYGLGLVITVLWLLIELPSTTKDAKGRPFR